MSDDVPTNPFVEKVARAAYEARRIGLSIPRLGIRELDYDDLPPEARAVQMAAAQAYMDVILAQPALTAPPPPSDQGS